MKNIRKIFSITMLITALLSICALIGWFAYGCIYENNYGSGIIHATASLIWMENLLIIFGAVALITGILGAFTFDWD